MKNLALINMTLKFTFICSLLIIIYMKKFGM